MKIDISNGIFPYLLVAFTIFGFIADKTLTGFKVTVFKTTLSLLLPNINKSQVDEMFSVETSV